MARPAKPVKRLKKLTLYYTRAENLIITKMAAKHGMSKAEFARLRSLSYKLKPRLTEEESGFYRKLTGMANNLNQLARAANRDQILKKSIMETIEAIKFTVSKLR